MLSNLLTCNLSGSPEDKIIFYVASFVGQDRVFLQSEDKSFAWKAYQTVFMVNTVLSSFPWVWKKMCLPSDFLLHQHQWANSH